MTKRGRKPARAFDLMQYAVSGARSRLQELGREAQELFRHFPQLRSESPFGRGDRGRRAAGSASADGAATGQPTRRRRRRRMSKEARERIAAAQRKRWAEQRKREASKAGASRGK